MICWPPFWHELVRTLGRWNLYVVATWPWIAPDSAPNFSHHFKVVYQFLFQSYLFMFSACFTDATGYGPMAATNSSGGGHEQPTAAATHRWTPPAFSGPHRRMPHLLRNLVDGDTHGLREIGGRSVDMPCSKKRHLMISPQLMLCLAPRSAAENQKQRRIHQCGHFPILCMKLFGGSMESIVGSHEFVTFCSLHGESQLVRSSLSFEYATKRPSFSRSSLETALQPLAVRASIPMGQVGEKCSRQIQSTIFASLKVTDIFRKTNMSLEK